MADLSVDVIEVLDGVVEIKLKCHSGDVKRIIGSDGAHINALRRWATLWGEAHGYSVSIPNFETPPDNRDRYDEFLDNPDWPRRRITNLFQTMIGLVAGRRIESDWAKTDSQTHIVFRFDERDDARLMGLLESPLKVLANVIGRKNGVVLVVHIRSKHLLAKATRR